MSVEAASAGISAGASMGASAGVESASSFAPDIASVGASSPEIGTPSFSSFPQPEVPSFGSPIITEIPKPAGLEYLDAPVEPLAGNFELHDIIEKSFQKDPVESINSIQIEPATFLSPKVVDEINSIVESEAEEAEAYNQYGPISPVSNPKTEPIEPSSVFDNQPWGIKQEAETEISQPAEATQEIGNLTTGLLTLGGVNISVVETQANAQVLQKAYAVLESLNFTEEETAAWKQKLASVATSAEIETQTQLSDAAGNEPPQNLDTANGEEDEEEEKVPPTKPKKALWRLDFIDDKVEDAEEFNRARNQLAGEIAQEIMHSGVDSKSQAEATAAQLDIPQSVNDLTKEAAGKLKIPAVTPRVSVALSAHDASDPKTIAKVIIKTVQSSPAVELVSYVKDSRIVEPKDLDAEAQELIAQGADAIIYREKTKKLGQWKQVQYLPHQNPLEAEEEKQAA